MDGRSKPLGKKAYGSIPHLMGSQRSSGDKYANEGQHKICCVKTRDEQDVVIVQEKLDGSNVSVAKLEGILIPLIRAGYPAFNSHYSQHHLFAQWVLENQEKFAFLEEGERVCGEWLAQAHGTLYNLKHDPFVAFDIFSGRDDLRLLYDEFLARIGNSLAVPTLLHRGGAFSIEAALAMLDRQNSDETYGFHGAKEKVEGAIWRVERNGKVEFLSKYVRPGKEVGKYLDQELWNWRPAKKKE